MVKVLIAVLLLSLPTSAFAQSATPAHSGMTAGQVGAAVGAGIGVGLGIAACVSQCSSDGFVYTAFFGVTGAAIGGLIGAALGHPSRHTGIDVAPILSPDARGGRVSFRF
jgi:hypothetical protein